MYNILMLAALPGIRNVIERVTLLFMATKKK
jgi:hypothetical protein